MGFEWTIDTYRYFCTKSRFLVLCAVLRRRHRLALWYLYEWGRYLRAYMHFNGLFHYLKRPSTNRRIPRRKHSYRTRPPPVYTLSYKSWPLKIQPVSKTPFLFYYTMYLSACLLFSLFKAFFVPFCHNTFSRPGLKCHMVCVHNT